jgi:hypothetical protein
VRVDSGARLRVCASARLRMCASARLRVCAGARLRGCAIAGVRECAWAQLRSCASAYAFASANASASACVRVCVKHVLQPGYQISSAIGHNGVGFLTLSSNLIKGRDQFPKLCLQTNTGTTDYVQNIGQNYKFVLFVHTTKLKISH